MFPRIRSIQTVVTSPKVPAMDSPRSFFGTFLHIFAKSISLIKGVKSNKLLSQMVPHGVHFNSTYHLEMIGRTTGICVVGGCGCRWSRKRMIGDDGELFCVRSKILALERSSDSMEGHEWTMVVDKAATTTNMEYLTKYPRYNLVCWTTLLRYCSYILILSYTVTARRSAVWSV